jgi:hypothetical protein
MANGWKSNYPALVSGPFHRHYGLELPACKRGGACHRPGSSFLRFLSSTPRAITTNARNRNR